MEHAEGALLRPAAISFCWYPISTRPPRRSTGGWAMSRWRDPDYVVPGITELIFRKRRVTL